ncbi:MAG: hypothetical protein KAJ29_01965 [Alphaproteobacteria bacterium]|nr:hypothetical protein [Alphaproteobacteria bacterium]
MKSQPFLFDANIFDDALPLSEEERTKLPEFSREEMEATRRNAFEEGKKAGFQESQESITNAMLTLLEKIESDVSVLFSSEEKRRNDYEQNATHLAAQIFTKTFPVYMEAHGVDELRTAVSDALSAHMVPEKIQIDVNDTVFEPFTKLIKEHTDVLQKQITFKADSSLPEYACRISWPDGGLLCDRNALSEKIFNILNHSLAEHGFSIHDGDNGEKDMVGDNEQTVDGETGLSEGDTGDDMSAENTPQDIPDQKNASGETTTSGES